MPKLQAWCKGLVTDFERSCLLQLLCARRPSAQELDEQRRYCCTRILVEKAISRPIQRESRTQTVTGQALDHTKLQISACNSLHSGLAARLVPGLWRSWCSSILEVAHGIEWSWFQRLGLLNLYTWCQAQSTFVTHLLCNYIRFPYNVRLSWSLIG